ncbi:MAG: gnd, 6-phosphogluconate dehydrogenase, decarboxylating [Candidatus Saccharibacteria bacterium]|nr:gnd, 6-phosphogluconate dehydrogenase, decarboxylating [Candidatus Saccharibacteria bacterium]
MKIALIGLGKMGQQIAEKLMNDGHAVVGYDQNAETLENLAAKGVIAAHNKAEVIAAFTDEPPVIWLMIPADFVETELTEWFSLLPADTILIDGGNSDFRLSGPRAEAAASHGINFVDIGTSGGVHGFENGFSLMVGGGEVVQTLKPILDTLVAPNGGWRHVGPAGAGHYVKMVHNAIEYGMMQSLAEGYQLLKEGPYDHLDLADIGDLWQQGSIIDSNLNGLTAQALRANPELEGIDGVVAESGEARWAVEAAHTSGMTLPVIEESLKIRLASQQGRTNYATKVLAALRNAFGGHSINQR